MPRMRICKPEFWQDEITGAWPGEVQSLFLALLTMADDHGRFEASANRILGFAYCQRRDVGPSQVEEWLQRVVSDDRAALYTSGGQRFGVILRFYKHQRPQKRFSPRCPMPPPEIVARILESCGSWTPGGIYTLSPTPNPSVSHVTHLDGTGIGGLDGDRGTGRKRKVGGVGEDGVAPVGRAPQGPPPGAPTADQKVLRSATRPDPEADPEAYRVYIEANRASLSRLSTGGPA